MPDSLANEIRERLARYVRGDAGLAEFEAWLVPETWDLSPQFDPIAHDLATAITLRIAEFTSGDWTEDELRGHLRGLITLVSIDPAVVQFGAAYAPTPQAQFSVGRKESEVVFG